jgi:hypothetical protein
MWQHILDWRRAQGLSTEDLRFVDIGLGIEGVVLATLILHHRIIQSAMGVEIDVGLHQKMIDWLDAIEKMSRALRHTASCIRESMLLGDFTSNDAVVESIQTADVVFSDNYLFNPSNKECPEQSGISLNDQLRNLLTEALIVEGACVVTTSPRPISHGRKRTQANMNSSRTTSGARTKFKLVTSHNFKFEPHHLSWHGNLERFITIRTPV